MKKFDTKVQYIKYQVLKEVAKESWDNTLTENILDIPKKIIVGKVPTMRCCVYKERAIIAERVKVAMGGDRNNKNVIEVIDIACDECPMGGYEVTNACRGCLAHRCEDACKRGAISFDDNHVAHIDKTKCVECGACAKYALIVPFTIINALVKLLVKLKLFQWVKTKKQKSTMINVLPVVLVYINAHLVQYLINQ